MEMNELFNNNNDFVVANYFEEADPTKFNIENFTHIGTHWCYMHGQLEEDNHYDCFYINKRVELAEDWVGMFPLKFNGKDCTFFRWINPIFKHGMGLVVYNDDTEAYEYAKKAFLEKQDNL